MMVLITGDRNWTNRVAMERVLQDHLTIDPMDVTFMHGGAKGADQLSGWLARVYGHEPLVIPADWHAHGRAAGPIRNEIMLNRLLQHPHIKRVYAFHNQLLLVSKGTRHMVEISRAARISVHLTGGWIK